MRDERCCIDFSLFNEGKDFCAVTANEKLEENFGAEPMMHAGIAETKITLGEDEYFVLGDNRNHSSDSRDPLVGPIDRSSFIGRVRAALWNPQVQRPQTAS